MWIQIKGSLVIVIDDKNGRVIKLKTTSHESAIKIAGTMWEKAQIAVDVI